MTILIINNYYKEKNLKKVNQVSQALRKVGKSNHEIWHFSEINKKSIKNDIEAIVLSGSAAHLQNLSRNWINIIVYVSLHENKRSIPIPETIS